MVALVEQRLVDKKEVTVAEQVRALVKREDSYAYRKFLGKYPLLSASKEPRFHVAWREKICEWTYNVADHFDLSREIVAVSLSLFDRFLATRGNHASGRAALLLSLTTLHIAMKLYATSVRISLRTLATLSRGQFTPHDVEVQERLVLDALDWKLHPPTPMSFLVQFVRLLPSSSRRAYILEHATYQAQQALCDCYFVSVPSSTTALAAVWNVLEEVDGMLVPLLLQKLERLVGIRPGTDEVQQARQRMESMLTTTAAPILVEDDDDHVMESPRASPISALDPTVHLCGNMCASPSTAVIQNLDS